MGCKARLVLSLEVFSCKVRRILHLALGGQQQPGGRQGRRRIADAHFTEVDHAGQRPAGDDDVRRMKITVDPYRRIRPGGSRDGLLPDPTVRGRRPD
jgi:hypothetical protein